LAGKEILEVANVSINVPGDNQISSLNATIADPDYRNSHLFNAKVEFYINEGGAQGLPTFVGYVKEVSTDDTSVSITAYDPRIFISGEDAYPVAITDKNNYDGYTPIQFITEIITERINTTTETKIDISALSDFSPEISMKGYRTSGDAPYSIFLALMERAVDDDKPEEPLPFFVDMLGDKLIVGKRKSINSGEAEQSTSGSRAYSLSFNDGLMTLNYTNINPPIRAVAIGGDDGWGEFQYGNIASGISGRTIGGDAENNAELSDLARIEIMKDYNETKEIRAQISRGYHVGLENIIYLDVPDRVLRGKHRVTSKTITSNAAGVQCSIGLDKREPRLGDFVKRKITRK